VKDEKELQEEALDRTQLGVYNIGEVAGDRKGWSVNGIVRNHGIADSNQSRRCEMMD